MSGAITVAVVTIAVVAVLSAAAIITAPRWTEPTWLVHGRRRVSLAVDGSVPYLGRISLALTVALSGFAVTLIIMYFLGKFAHALEPSVDVPVFNWFQERQIVGSWHSVWETLTKMGNRAQTQRIVVVGALVLAVAWRRRGFWIPLFALPVGYLFEKFGQMLVSRLVDRGHPPTTLGTWPSGGCARLMIVYGLVIFFVLSWRNVSRRGWVAGWSLLALLVTIESYSRTYLLKHWFTDVVGGVIYGALLLAFMIAAVKVLDRRRIPLRPLDSAPLGLPNRVPAQLT